MLGFLFGLALGASAMSGDDIAKLGSSQLIYLDKGIAGVEFDPMKVGVCVAGTGSIEGMLAYCVKNYDTLEKHKGAWKVVRVLLMPNGNHHLTLVRP